MEKSIWTAVAATIVCAIVTLAIQARARAARQAKRSARGGGELTHPAPSGVVVCIGDVHGHIRKLQRLWGHLESELGDEGLAAAVVIFLGDYVDRGPDSSATLDWIISTASARAPGRTRFIAGNHDFGMACFMGCLPGTVPQGYNLDSTTPQEYTSGFWPHSVPGGMHYMGRRWGGSNMYQAETTFESYGLHFDAAR